MEGDTLNPFPDDTERGWSVWVLAYPTEGVLPSIPQGWVSGIERHHDQRQVIAAWDPKRFQHAEDYAAEGLVTIFTSASFPIKLVPCGP